MPKDIDRRQFLIGSGVAAATVAVGVRLSRAQPSRVRVVGLKVNHVEHPLGLENLSPRLSWRLEAYERNVRQSEYRILVASTIERLESEQADLWDSGRISSRQSF